MTIKSPREQSPLLVELENRQSEINSRIAELTLEAQANRARQDAKQPNQGNIEANSLNRLLGKKVGPDILPDAEQLPKLLAELDQLKAAQQSLSRAIRNETTAASRLVCEHVAPEHSRLAKQFAAKLLDLHAAHLEYIKFVDDVEDTGADIGSLNVVTPNAFGHPRDASGGYHYSLKDFRDAGIVDLSQIPECIQ